MTKIAGVGTGAAALSGVASAADSGLGSRLFDPGQAGVTDGTRFGAVDVQTMRDHDDLLTLEAADIKSAWTSGDGSASVDEMVEDVSVQFQEPVADIKTVFDNSDVDVDTVDRVSALGSDTLGADGHVSGVVVEGSFDSSKLIDALSKVASVRSDGSVAGYDRYSVGHDSVGNVTVAVGSGRVIAARTDGVDADGTDVVNWVDGARTGDAPRFGPNSVHSEQVMDELSDMPAVGGAEWTVASDAHKFVPKFVDSKLESHGYVPDGVSLRSIARDAGAAAVGIDPASQRAKLVVSYDRDPLKDSLPVSDVRDLISSYEDEYPDAFEDVSWSVGRSGSLLIVEASTTADRLESVQSDFDSKVLGSPGGLREGLVWGATPTLRGAGAAVRDHFEAFVSDYA